MKKIINQDIELFRWKLNGKIWQILIFKKILFRHPNELWCWCCHISVDYMLYQHSKYILNHYIKNRNVNLFWDHLFLLQRLSKISGLSLGAKWRKEAQWLNRYLTRDLTSCQSSIWKVQYVDMMHSLPTTIAPVRWRKCGRRGLSSSFRSVQRCAWTPLTHSFGQFVPWNVWVK